MLDTGLYLHLHLVLLSLARSHSVAGVVPPLSTPQVVGENYLGGLECYHIHITSD